jgi:putative sigma-54 modulation protein
MKIDVHSSGFPLTDAIKHYAMRRIQFALSWADGHVRRSAVRLSDLNGPRGGNDKRCQVQLTSHSGESASIIVIEETQSDLYAAIDRAIDRAGRTLARKLQRERQRVRSQRRQAKPAEDYTVAMSPS